MPSYYKTNLGTGREKIHTYYSCHISNHKTINADRKYRELSYNLEWMLYREILHKALKTRAMKKIKAKKAEGILAVPCRPNHACLSVLFKMLIDTPVLITSMKNLLNHPQNLKLVHFIWRKIDMVVYHLVVSSQKAMEFKTKLKRYWKHRGNRQQRKDLLGMYSHPHNADMNEISMTFRQPPN